MTQPLTPPEVADRLTFIGLHASRFNDSEYGQARDGLCISQTEYGMPWAAYCNEVPDYRSLHCMEHGREIRQREGRNAFGLDIYPLYPGAVAIESVAELRAVADAIGLKDHEPDEQDNSATVTGIKLDNATGVTGPDYVVYLRHDGPDDAPQMWAVNLSDLISWARHGA
jgi:hypothetical protein